MIFVSAKVEDLVFLKEMGMEIRQIRGQKVVYHPYNTVIVGAGAAGMNAAIHLYEFFQQQKVADAHKKIAVLTAGIKLGASRMSGSDKQTYYKMGTSPETPDSAEAFAASLTAAGCCHGDLALAEGIGSLREFYHLVQAGVPFPHDPLGSYIGYKTDHDPYERATSAGPKTSRYMSECLERQARRYGISIFDGMETVLLLTQESGADKRIVGVSAVRKKDITPASLGLHVFGCENLILAAGGPGELYATTVYPKNQFGLHGLALKAGLYAENLTESQYGLASTKFRWNVSGSYMQVIPRIFSTDGSGGDEREFLAGFFDSMRSLTTAIFLKGYQWPFDPQRIQDPKSSLIDILVFTEIQKGRRVFMDFLRNPIGDDRMKSFEIEDLEDEARIYLNRAGAVQKLPIERLAHMNPLAIDIYREHGIDLLTKPLEIAVCAQHNNGGFSVDRWWQSNIPGVFVIGEMAATHGVKRPGGAALNAGQVGGLRAAERIAYTRPLESVHKLDDPSLTTQMESLVDKFTLWSQNHHALSGQQVLQEIQSRMTLSAAHIRELSSVQTSLGQAIELYRRIESEGLRFDRPTDLIAAVRAEHLALTSIAYLKAIAELLAAGGGSRGSYLVLTEKGQIIHPNIRKDGKILRFKPENTSLREQIQQLEYSPCLPDLFKVRMIPVRPMPKDRKPFESVWKDYREGRIFTV